jgi:hypothetical protein
MRGTMLAAKACDCASAPARGGSMTTAPYCVSSSGSNGLRNKSRVSVVTRFSPVACRQPWCKAASMSGTLSTACSSARSASGRLNVPHPANRSATRPACPTASATADCIARCAGSVACRNAPGGGVTIARPNACAGGLAKATTSPSQANRASPLRPAHAPRSARKGPSSALPPVTDRSRPTEAIVTDSANSPLREPAKATSSSSSGSAATSSGRRIRQSGMPVTVSDARA